MNDPLLEYLKVIGGLLLSWPVIILIIAVAFRKPLGELIGQLHKGKIGPLQFEAFDRLVERGNSSLSTTERLNIEIAESRITELEATSAVLSGDLDALSRKKEEIDAHVTKLRATIGELAPSKSTPETRLNQKTTTGSRRKPS
jgi:hypothetical protein